MKVRQYNDRTEKNDSTNNHLQNTTQIQLKIEGKV
jgi:hypothetical protein